MCRGILGNQHAEPMENRELCWSGSLFRGFMIGPHIGEILGELAIWIGSIMSRSSTNWPSYHLISLWSLFEVLNIWKIQGGLPYISPATVHLRSMERSRLCLIENKTPGRSLSSVEWCSGSEGWSSSPAGWSSSCGAGWSGCSHSRGEVECWRYGVQ